MSTHIYIHMTHMFVHITHTIHIILTDHVDRISHGLIDHHNRLLSKFVGIVGDFVDSSASRLKAVDWDRFQVYMHIHTHSYI